MIQPRLGYPPANKRRRVEYETFTRPPQRILNLIPKLSSYDLRRNRDIADATKNPLIGIHQTEPLKAIIELIRMHSKIQTFCIGKETKSLKEIRISSQSPTSALCSEHIEQGLRVQHTGYNLPALSFCLMNYQCECNTNHSPSPNVTSVSFTIPSGFRSNISNRNYPSELISIQINDAIVGYFFVKTAAPSNLKRMCQPSTFAQFRMSISQSVLLTTNAPCGWRMNLLIRSKTNKDTFAVGIGYYFTARAASALDLVCCMTDVEDTEFVFQCDSNTAQQIKQIRCTMHMEYSSRGAILFETGRIQPMIAPMMNHSTLHSNHPLERADIAPTIVSRRPAAYQYLPVATVPAPTRYLALSYSNVPITITPVSYNNNYVLFVTPSINLLPQQLNYPYTGN